MERGEVIKQLELYSNAIVAFMVVQSLAFCYNFGTSKEFNKIIHGSKELSIGLALAFILTLGLAAFANSYIRLKLEAMSGEYAHIVKAVYLGKIVVIAIFGTLPILALARYAIFPS